jgi:hypothetical protein
MPQEWANLRAQGIKTPEIAAWQRMPVEGMGFGAANKARAIYPYVLNVYNDPRFSQVIGKPVLPTTTVVLPDCRLHPAMVVRHAGAPLDSHMQRHKLRAEGNDLLVQVIMKDAVTRKKIFFIPRADQFDERWTADVQLNSERACRACAAAAGPAAA